MELIDKSFIANQLKRICSDRNMSVRELSQEFEMPYQTLLNYSNGSRQPKWDFLILLDNIGINLRWFVTGKGNMYRRDTSLAVHQRVVNHGRESAVVSSGINNGTIVNRAGQGEPEVGSDRAGTLCAWINDYMKNHSDDEGAWLDVEMGRKFPEYKEWKNGR